MALLVEAKIFSYKINVILCHNVNFDVTIMTSWRHFLSTLGCFCRQIISRKSHQRNFLNLLPFKSYKQRSKSWVIPPLYRIRVNNYKRYEIQRRYGTYGIFRIRIENRTLIMVARINTCVFLCEYIHMKLRTHKNTYTDKIRIISLTFGDREVEVICWKTGFPCEINL